MMMTEKRKRREALRRGLGLLLEMSKLALLLALTVMRMVCQMASPKPRLLLESEFICLFVAVNYDPVVNKSLSSLSESVSNFNVVSVEAILFTPQQAVLKCQFPS